MNHVSERVPTLFPQDAFEEAVKFFGENSKTTPPSVFFPVFVRFVKAYRVSVAKEEAERVCCGVQMDGGKLIFESEK